MAKASGIEESEEFTVAGLLHDLGKVVTAVQLPDIQQRIQDKVESDDLSWFEAERGRHRLWPRSHQRLGGRPTGGCPAPSRKA